ncbi:uncharacterized protein KGF55_002793 [Candida pseudojiufengensis]|uniref:uncharacterized protein n=1 Tax=Candida pseudojiufengensis TaxID=497109 RepID=UPI0022247F06|nr:uncharacterized protein KGF55_002793 [Candida pseudojiufengensis]KAI5963001.1 hypothetical protein KGF55_002793 [Candida pseudojiufengensis]
MQIFLKLPEELLSLIIKYVNDKSKIERLIKIPALQQYAIKERYSQFKLNTSYEIRDGSIEKLIALFKEYNFKPSRILGNTNDIYKLLRFGEEESSYMTRQTRSQAQNSGSNNRLIDFSQVDYEILFCHYSEISELEEIFRNVNLVSIKNIKYHTISRNTTLDQNREISTLLDIINTSKLESLDTVYSNRFKVKFSTSLKELKLNFGREKIELNLNELANLELFHCYNLNGVDSLDDIQLPKFIKNLELHSCAQVLGDIEQYSKLRYLTVDCCDALFQLMNCFFPVTLEEIRIINNISKAKVAELFRAVSEGTNTQFEKSDFSVDGRWFLIGPSFEGLPKLKLLSIQDAREAIEVRVSTFIALNSLSLVKVNNIDLNQVLSSLSGTMFKIEIKQCKISGVESAVVFPESKHIIFLNNNLSTIFKSNLNNLKKLVNLQLRSNRLQNLTEIHELDPCEILNFNDEDFNASTGESKKKVGKRSKTIIKDSLTFNAPKLEVLYLSKKDMFMWGRRTNRNSGKLQSLPSQLSLIECTNLRKLNIMNTILDILDLNNLPNSLVYLSITKNKLKLFKGEFKKLNKLKELDLKENEINYSMLANQTFPQSLKLLDLSENKIEDLTCLYLDNCVNLRTLMLVKVTGSDEPEGANKLKKWFLKINANAKTNRGYLTNRKSKIIFNVVNGVDVRERSSTGSGSKKRKRVNDPAYR